MLNWWSSQDSSLSASHGASLVVVLGWLLILLTQMPFVRFFSLGLTPAGGTIPGRILLFFSLLPVLGAHLGLPGARLVSSQTWFFFFFSSGSVTDHSDVHRSEQ